MPIRINYAEANLTLLEAIALAQAGPDLPVEWVSHARTVFSLNAKTWTPALGTLLLAKATDGRVDTLSIKSTNARENAYSIRVLCHTILVPAAVEHNFSIRNTGAEPLNNQPWFRYDRIDEIDRVRDPEDLKYFRAVAESANELSSEAALLALAAFIKVALEAAASTKAIRVKAYGLSPNGLRIAAEDFLRTDAKDRPRRLQAFSAACLSLVFEDVKTRRINDPSRDWPGDVQAFAGSTLLLAMEVKGKPVSPTDVSSFMTRCSGAGIDRATVLVDAIQHEPLKMADIYRNSNIRDVQVTVFESSAALLEAALIWSASPLSETIASFSDGLLLHLRKIEVDNSTLEEWTRAVSIAREQ